MLDEIMFAEDVEEEEEITLQPWKILIVDDESEVHAVTKLALSDFIFLNRRIQFLSAYSGEQACQFFREHDDIAVVLLDVVMETDDAGLKVAEYVRDELNNHFTRIILRTGQPGQAPEKDIIVNYDINDYKSKTELTAQKLFTVIVAALRSYRDIIVINENRLGLEKIVAGTGNLFNSRSVEGFIEGLVQQLMSLLGGTEDAAYITSAVAAPSPIDNVSSDKYFVFSGKGEYRNLEGKSIDSVISGEHLNACREALKDKTVVYGDEFLVAYCHSKFNRGSLLYLSGLPHKLSDHDKRLVQLFSHNVQLAFDNVLLIKDTEDAQQELLGRLFRASGKQATEDTHISRVIKLCELMAHECGLSTDSTSLFKIAVCVNEGNKVPLPERVLKGIDELTQAEINNITQNAQDNYQILKGSERPVVQLAALLARDYHEKWDGSGYPNGLAGDDIDMHCRIVTVADCYIQLLSSIGSQEREDSQHALTLMKKSSGSRFDPTLLELLDANLERFNILARDTSV
jgi:response regulator RpfG family c-di-GMP phosphodiesterase